MFIRNGRHHRPSVKIAADNITFFILYSVVAYGSGVDHVARFEASIEIFGDCTPSVKGLPTTMMVKETISSRSYQASTTRRTYEDPFSLDYSSYAYEVYYWLNQHNEISLFRVLSVLSS